MVVMKRPRLGPIAVLVLHTMLAAPLPIAAAAVIASPGCATVSNVLPKIVAAATQGSLVLDTLDTFADQFFKAAPNAELEKKVDIGLARARNALAIALAAARGGEMLTQAQIDDAFKEFAKAYGELVVIMSPLGVKSGERLGAAGGGLQVPMAAELVPRVGGP
jgi:hypothetical protein